MSTTSTPSYTEHVDDRTARANEITQTDELLRNERTFPHPTFGSVRIVRPTPFQERSIAEARRKQYHQDFQDRTILSKTEMEREAVRRGIWSLDKTERMQEMQTRIGQIMGLLDVVGYESVDMVVDRYNAALTTLGDLFEGKPVAQAAVVRYFDLNGRPDPADHKLIFEAATSTTVDDAMNEATLYRTQVELLTELATARKELQPLLMEQARLFKDSVEARMDRTEELAKVYYCSSTPDGKPLWPTFEAMHHAPPSDLEILLEEMYFFEHGILDSYRRILSRHSFTLRAPSTAPSSDASPGAPTSNSSGESPLSEPTSSSASTASAT